MNTGDHNLSLPYTKPRNKATLVVMSIFLCGQNIYLVGDMLSHS